MHARSTRLVLAALVAGATGVASASGASAAAELAGAVGRVGLIRTAACAGAGQTQATCIQLGCTVRRDLAQVTSTPVVACRALAPAPAAPPHIVSGAPHAAPPAPRAIAVLPLAPKTSPPIS